MNYKQKLGYTLLGAGIMGIGLTVGQFVAPDIEAQSNGVFDKITCRELEVVDAFGNTAVSSVANNTQNGMVVYDKSGNQAVVLVSDESVPVNGVHVHNQDGDKAIRLTHSDNGAIMNVYDQLENMRVNIQSSSSGGSGVAILDAVGNIIWMTGERDRQRPPGGYLSPSESKRWLEVRGHQISVDRGGLVMLPDGSIVTADSEGNIRVLPSQ